jgi:hypothetical protein
MAPQVLHPRWKPKAAAQWDRLAERAPNQAIAVFRAIEWLAARRGMADLGRRDPDGKKRRYWPVPPQGIFYAVRGETLWVLEIRDARRRRTPW